MSVSSFREEQLIATKVGAVTWALSAFIDAHIRVARLRRIGLGLRADVFQRRRAKEVP